jgi:hypothetical protein
MFGSAVDCETPSDIDIAILDFKRKDSSSLEEYRIPSAVVSCNSYGGGHIKKTQHKLDLSYFDDKECFRNFYNHDEKKIILMPSHRVIEAAYNKVLQRTSRHII